MSKFEDSFQYKFKKINFEKIETLFEEISQRLPNKPPISYLGKMGNLKFETIGEVRDNFANLNESRFLSSLLERNNVFLIINRYTQIISLHIETEETNLFDSLRSLVENSLGLKQIKQQKVISKINSNFIKNPGLKKLIKENYLIAVSNYENKHWKVTIIMCGSILEGVLDYLISLYPKSDYEKVFHSNFPGKKPKKLNDLKLEEKIKISQGLGILGKDSGFADTVRKYRNYIHPMLELKAKEKANQKRAKLALDYIELFFDNLSNSIT